MKQPKLNRLSFKEDIRIMFWGDLHFGHPQCNIEKATEYLDYAKENDIKIIIMGDLLECSLKDSIGDVYSQEMSPQMQMETIIELLRPYKHLILGIHYGNHEKRVYKHTSIDIIKVVCSMLGVTYFGYNQWHYFIVGDQNYTMYTTHGHGGGKTNSSKLRVLHNLKNLVDVDIVAMGHLHSLINDSIVVPCIDKRMKKISDRTKHMIMTGSFLDWHENYSQDAGMEMAKLGSPIIKLFKDKNKCVIQNLERDA